MGPRMREELLAFVSERGTLLEPDAVEFLLVQRDPIAELDGFLRSCPETPFVVTLEDIRHSGEIARRALRSRSPVDPRPVAVVASVAASFRRQGGKAVDGQPDVRILRDITGHPPREGALQDFTPDFRPPVPGLR